MTAHTHEISRAYSQAEVDLSAFDVMESIRDRSAKSMAEQFDSTIYELLARAGVEAPIHLPSLRDRVMRCRFVGDGTEEWLLDGKPLAKFWPMESHVDLTDYGHVYRLTRRYVTY